MVMPQVRDAVRHSRQIVFSLTLMTSLICCIGVGLDILAISLSPQFSSIEWRMGFMQQFGERCLIILFGGALLCYSLQTVSVRRKSIAWICCCLGLCISLSSIFYLQDSIRFRSSALENLNTQQQNLENKIQEFTTQQRVLPNQVIDLAKKEQALSLLNERTHTLEERAKVRLQKTVARTFSSLVIAGGGLISIGMLTLRSDRVFNPLHSLNTLNG